MPTTKIQEDLANREIMIDYYPSFCPKPEPGTVEIPVASKSLRQYKTSGTFPNCFAASIALGGRRICGKEYMAPDNK